MLALTVAALLGCVPATVLATTKVWRHNTNFSNPVNWEPPRLPCSADRVIFPRDFGQFIVQLPDGETMMRELVLPLYGDFVFPFVGSLVFTGDSHGYPGCKGEDIEFTRNEAKAWLDPSSWIPEDVNPEDADVVLKAVPHLERIPCQFDNVVFPEYTSFSVQLPEVPVHVGSVNLHGQLLNEMDWTTLTTSGNMMGVSSFVGRMGQSSFVHVQNHRCLDPQGCDCNPASMDVYKASLFEIMCSYARVECERNGLPTCFEPVTPVGHCCSICGAHLQLRFHSSHFTLENLQKAVERHVGKDVVFHVSNLGWHRAQVVLVDRENYNARSPDVANSLKTILLEDDSLGVTSVSVFASGEVYFAHTWERVMAPIMGTLVAALAVLGAIFLVFVTCRHRIPLGILDGNAFFFARFENIAEGDGEIVDVRTVTPRYDEQDEEAPLSKAFDNPMYGKTKEATGATSSMVTQENPIYSELQNAEEVREKSATKSAMEAEMLEVDIESMEPDTL